MIHFLEGKSDPSDRKKMFVKVAVALEKNEDSIYSLADMEVLVSMQIVKK